MLKERKLRTEQLEDRRLLAVLDGVEFRSIDGSGNNQVEVSQGAADTRVIRFGYPGVFPDGHGDQIDVAGRPNARTISNAIHAQSQSVPNDRNLTDWAFQWGQFLTHDMDLTLNGPEFNTLSDGSVGDFNIPILDAGDILGPNPIPFNRSAFDPTTGTTDLIPGPFGPRPNWREQINSVTSYIDASNVYGSDVTRADALRSFQGGKLLVSSGNLLPLNENGLPNEDVLGLGSSLFLAGDVRANEQVALTATHTLFLREHNRLADRIHHFYPTLNDEEIYLLARRLVAAEMQAITYNEFLPAVLGTDISPKAADAVYSEDVNASITNSFSTAIFRFGHSLISEELIQVTDGGNQVSSLSLDEAFFNPDFLKDDPLNVDRILRGLATQNAQEVDLLLTDGVRNNLFGPAGGGGIDLGALDIQRGRAHGLPDYNSLRRFYGIEKVSSFAEISSDPAMQIKIEELYGNVDNIDAFVGVLAEDHVPGASVGELTSTIIVNQFTRLRDGDRFFYANDDLLNSPFAKKIVNLHNVTLSKVIKQNTDNNNIQDNVFVSDPGDDGGRRRRRPRPRDGDTDLVVPNFSDDKISVLFNNGDGTFGKLQIFTTGGNQALQVVASGLDGDPDMILHVRVEDTNLDALYTALVADDINADGILNSTNQEVETTLTGETFDDSLFQGSDDVNAMLLGKSLRDLLDELFALGLI